MRSYLICPVRGVDPKVHAEAVSRLETEGYTVHFPPRDTDQSDPVGLQICTDNKSAMMDADTVHVIWDGISEGCLFDLGMAFALKKQIQIVDMPPETNGKSFQNMARAWAGQRGD